MNTSDALTAIAALTAPPIDGNRQHHHLSATGAAAVMSLVLSPLNYGGFYGHDTADMMPELNVRDAQRQSFLANQ
jgi:hypothetical protein